MHVNGADLTVVELSLKSLEICKQRFKVYGLRARFYEGNIEELSNFVPIEKYDLVYAFGVIHHTPHPEKVVSEVKNIMEPDSEFRLNVICKKFMESFYDRSGI